MRIHRPTLGFTLAALVVATAFLSAAPGAAGARPDTLAPRLLAAIEGRGPAEPIEVIVLTKGPAAPAAEAARAMGYDVVWTYDLIDGFSARTTVGALDLLGAQPWTKAVWDSRQHGTLLDVSVKDIRAHVPAAAGWDGSTLTIAVIDTGVEITDAAFSGAIAACVSTIGGLAVPECDDTDGHGTHVAATALGRHATHKGVAHGAKLAAVRVLHAAGAGTSGDIIAGMNWVKNNKNAVTPPIRVASMSIGYVNPGCGDGTEPEALAADALVAAGVSFAIAAGNSGYNKCTVDGASAAFNVVTVGAADDRGTTNPADDRLASFSSGGPTADGRLKPEVVAPGVAITAPGIGPLLWTMDGTSMATPHVAGVMAQLIEKDPTLTPAQVKSKLTSTAYRPTAATGLPNNDWGHGLVDACRAAGMTGC